jgi:hypothetical protein
MILYQINSFTLRIINEFHKYIQNVRFDWKEFYVSHHYVYDLYTILVVHIVATEFTTLGLNSQYLVTIDYCSSFTKA